MGNGSLSKAWSADMERVERGLSHLSCSYVFRQQDVLVQRAKAGSHVFLGWQESKNILSWTVFMANIQCPAPTGFGSSVAECLGPEGP